MTGWKSLFGAGQQVHHGWIDGVTDRESDILKAYCEYILTCRIDDTLVLEHDVHNPCPVLILSSLGNYLQQPRPSGSIQMEQE